MTGQEIKTGIDHLSYSGQYRAIRKILIDGSRHVIPHSSDRVALYTDEECLEAIKSRYHIFRGDINNDDTYYLIPLEYENIIVEVNR